MALLCLLPCFIPIIILLRFTGEGEVFYRQTRMGIQQNTFGILKFATMLKDSLNIGSKTVTTRNDPRITPMGKWLRMTKINELPQLWNVFVGDMSFVGPRPLLVKSFLKYAEDVQAIITQNKPGITGLGSIVFRDEEKLTSHVKKLGGEPLGYYRFYIYPYKGELEVYYHKHKGLWTDLKILLLTAWKIVFKHSQIEYLFFSDLPKKPISLTLQGIEQLDMTKVKEIDV